MKPELGGKCLTYRETKVRVGFDFSETMQARREWSEIFKVLREKINLTWNSVPCRIIFQE